MSTAAAVALAIPDASTVTVERARVLAGQVANWSQTVDDVDALEDARAKLAAIETYLRRRAESASAEIARANRELEIRIGELLGRAKDTQGRRTDLSPAGEKSTGSELSRNQRSQFRKMAERKDEPAVKAAVEKGAPRAEVLRKVAQVEAAEKAAEVEREIDTARREQRELMDRLQPQGFDPEEDRRLIRQRGALARICREVAELGDPADFVAGNHQFRDRLLAIAIDARAAHAWLGAYLELIGDAAA